MRRVLLGIVVLLGLWVGVVALARALASDETKIRRLLASMVEAYDDGRPAACVAPLAQDWRHEGVDVDREALRTGLIGVSLERDRETHELLTRVTLDADAADVRVDGARATLACDATFARLRRGAWQDVWRAHFEAELAKTDDGWKVETSRHRDLAGARPGD